MYFEIVLYNSNCTFSNASGVQFTRSETSNPFSLSFAIKTEGFLLIVSNRPSLQHLLMFLKNTSQFGEETGIGI